MDDKNEINFRNHQYGVYGRIKKAVTFGYRSKPSPQAEPITDSKESKHGQIEFDHSAFSKIDTNEPGFNGSNDRVVRTAGVNPGGKRNELAGNDRFTDYIKRARMRMRRSMTVVGGGGTGGKGTSRLESINKKTSAYIDRAKVKLRTASIVGFGRKSNG